jgi:predicted nucleic acid-binding protein
MIEQGVVLVDTSVWIDVLPSRRPASPLRDRVDGLIGDGRVVIAGPVTTGLLRGAIGEREYEILSAMCADYPHLPIRDSTWVSAGRLGFQLRREGITVPTTDLLIAAVAMEADAILLHRDRHYDVIAERCPLKVESWAG